MASQQLVIAKASFTSTLFRRDPEALPRPIIDQLDGLLHAATTHCSPANVQACRKWIVDHVVASDTRSAAFIRYLICYSESMTGDDRKPRVRRRRVYLLYVINDVIHHAKSSAFIGALCSSLSTLFITVLQPPRTDKNTAKIASLLTIWSTHNLIPSSVITSLQDLLDSDVPLSVKEPTLPVKQASFAFPATHGHPAAPWHQLPPGNWLPHLTPNSPNPMNPNQIKALPLTSNPPSAALTSAVETLLSSVDALYARPPEIPLEITPTGETPTETYYGWSNTYCQVQKSRPRAQYSPPRRGQSPPKNAFPPPLSHQIHRVRSRSPRRSRSRSRSPRGDDRQMEFPPIPFPPVPPPGYPSNMPWPPPLAGMPGATGPDEQMIPFMGRGHNDGHRGGWRGRTR